MSRQRTGKCFIYRTTTFGYIHLISSCSKSCCNTANLERAHFYWHEQVGPVPLYTAYWDFAPYNVCWTWTWKVNKNSWTLILVAEERVASPHRTAQWVSISEKGLWRVFLFTQFKYAHMRGGKSFTRYKLKATFIAANWEQLSGGGNTNKRSKVRHLEAKISLIIMYLLVSNVSCTWNVH